MDFCQLFETPILTGDHPDHDVETINNAIKWLADGKETPIESHKFSIIEKDHVFALKRNKDGKVMGWAQLEPPKQMFNRIIQPLVKIYVLLEFRNTIATYMLLHYMREFVKYPILVSGAIFTDGQKLLNAINKRSDEAMPNISTINLKTGETKPYTSSDLKTDPNVGFLLERTEIEYIYVDKIPGSVSRLMLLEVFNRWNKELK